MSAEVNRDSTLVRPSFKYPAQNSYDSAQCELLESARNVLEDIQRSQMLQCDVAHAIKDMAKTLRRIDRRLAKVEEAKLAGGRK